MVGGGKNDQMGRGKAWQEESPGERRAGENGHWFDMKKASPICQSSGRGRRGRIVCGLKWLRGGEKEQTGGKGEGEGGFGRRIFR